MPLKQLEAILERRLKSAESTRKLLERSKDELKRRGLVYNAKQIKFLNTSAEISAQDLNLSQGSNTNDCSTYEAMLERWLKSAVSTRKLLERSKDELKRRYLVCYDKQINFLNTSAKISAQDLNLSQGSDTNDSSTNSDRSAISIDTHKSNLIANCESESTVLITNEGSRGIFVKMFQRFFVAKVKVD